MNKGRFSYVVNLNCIATHLAMQMWLQIFSLPNVCSVNKCQTSRILCIASKKDFCCNSCLIITWISRGPNFRTTQLLTIDDKCSYFDNSNFTMESPTFFLCTLWKTHHAISYNFRLTFLFLFWFLNNWYFSRAPWKLLNTEIRYTHLLNSRTHCTFISDIYLFFLNK